MKGFSSRVPKVTTSGTGKARSEEIGTTTTFVAASRPTHPTSSNMIIPQAQPYQRSVNFWGIAQEKLQSDPLVPAAVKTIFSDRTDESDATAILHEAEAAKTNYFQRQWTYNRGPDGAATFQDTINKIILSAGKFSSVIDSLTDCDPSNYARLAWGGIRIFLVAATQNIQLHESVLEGMAYVSSLITETLETMIKLIFINQPPSIKNLKTVHLLQDHMIKLYACTLHYLGLTNLYYKKGAWGRASMSLAGPENSDIIRILSNVQDQERKVREYYDMVCGERAFQEAEIQSVGLAESQSALDAVIGAQRQLGEQLQMLHTDHNFSQAELARSVAETRETLDQTSNHLRSLEIRVRELCNQVHLSSSWATDEMQAEKRMKLLQWVSPEPYQQYHEDCLDAVLVNSYSWIYETKRFKDWYCKDLPSMLLLSGEKGSGKTTIVSQIIGDLQRGLVTKLQYIYGPSASQLTPAGNPKSSIVLYYYFKPYSSTNRGLASDILASLLRQLCSEDSVTFTELQKHYQIERNKGFPSRSIPMSTIHRVLYSSFVRLLKPCQMAIYIVVDGLHELNTKEMTILMRSLKELTQVCIGFTKVLATTRSYSYTNASVSHEYFFHLGYICIEPYKFREKIIRAEISRLSREIQVPCKEPGKYRGLSNPGQDRIMSEVMAKPEPLSESFRRLILDMYFSALRKERTVSEGTYNAALGST